MLSTLLGVIEESTEYISAIAAATCGDAIDVPLIPTKEELSTYATTLSG